MRHHSISLTIAMTIMLTALISCDKTHDQVIEFLTQLQTAHQNGDKEMIAQLYPAAAEADSMVINFDPKTVKIRPDSGDTLTADLDDGTDLVLVWQATGSLQAVASHGLFAYPADRLDLAKKTGQYKPSLNDAENAQRMADKEFTDKLYEKVMKQVKKQITVSEEIVQDNFEGCKLWQITIRNGTDMELAAKDYNINIKETSVNNIWEEMRAVEEVRAQTSIPGQTIAPKGTIQIMHKDGGGAGCVSIYANLIYNLSKEKVMSTYHFTGNEYEEYLATKNK